MGAKKTKTTQTSNETSKIVKDVPDWINNQTQAINTGITGYLGNDPSTLVAKTSPLTQQAYDTASALNPSTMFDKVPTLNASSLLENLGAYQNPYLKDVVDTTLGDYDVNSGRVRANQAAQAAQGGAFRGSRYALREANTEGELARGRAAAEAGLRSDAFKTAAGLSSQDADRRQSAGAFNATQALQMAQAKQQAATTQSQLLAALGGQQQAQNQAEINAPLTQLQNASTLLASLNPQNFIGSTANTTGTSTGTAKTPGLTLLGWLAGNAELAGNMLSGRGS